MMVTACENAHEIRCGLLESPREKVWMHDALDADKTSLCRCAAVETELLCGGQDRHAVRRESVLQVHVEPKSQ